MDSGTPAVFPSLPQPLRGLVDLAFDLRWATDPQVVGLWAQVDEEGWGKTGRPLALLQSVSLSRLTALATDRAFLGLLRSALEARAERLASAGWFQEQHADGPLGRVAYFCMEFGLGEALPMYAGGLGILAGDHLKACSDLGVPVVGIGLLYQRGYFRQALSTFGSQVEIYPFCDPAQMPLVPTRDSFGDWLTITIELPQGEVTLRVWEAQVGTVRLYLLDSNHPLNSPSDRGLIGELYGSGTETRLQQEIILGLGGWQLLRKLGHDPEICHINEGHAAFSALERARCFMNDRSVEFSVALTATRAGNLFTTHTPVAAGFDCFPPGLIRQYLGEYASQLGLEFEEFLGLGRIDTRDVSESFNMAQLAIKTCGAINAVSRLHAEVSRGLFSRSFPGMPLAEVPIGQVTNAVHVPTWLSGESHQLWTERYGPDCWFVPGPPEERTANFSDEALWELRRRSRERLVRAVRDHAARHRGDPWRPRQDAGSWAELLDPSALTLGFARRFTGYKRCALLLSDPDRLARMLASKETPTQLVIAGKAHPADDQSKATIRAWAEFTRRPDVQQRIAFLVDYDMTAATHLVQGADVSMNNPQRLLEASGTSGMKALANGGLNVSVLDGWWAEAYAPGLGWAIGDSNDHEAGPEHDREEAEQLYDRLEQEVIPLFFERDSQGIPRGWLQMVRNSMEDLAPRYAANRMVADYVAGFYLPGALAYRQRTASEAETAREIEAWKVRIRGGWAGVRFGRTITSEEDGRFVFEVEVTPGLLEQEFRAGNLSVEVYADPESSRSVPVRASLALLRETDGDLIFGGNVPATRPADRFTARILPDHRLLFGRAELPLTLWGR